jgi:ADP-ribose pyrophosphatase YjhB (NUDIX family)
VFPGGFSHLGESVARTAVRRVWETTGLAVTPSRILGVYSSPHLGRIYSDDERVQQVGVLFRARVAGDAPALATDDAASQIWVAPATLARYSHPAGWDRLLTLAADHLDDGYFLY